MSAADEAEIAKLFEGFAAAMVAWEDESWERSGSVGWDDPIPDEVENYFPEMLGKLAEIHKKFCVADKAPGRRDHENPSEYADRTIESIEVDGDDATAKVVRKGEDSYIIFRLTRTPQGWRLVDERDSYIGGECYPCPL